MRQCSGVARLLKVGGQRRLRQRRWIRDAEGVEWRDAEGIEGGGEWGQPTTVRGLAERRLPQAENEFGACWSCQKATAGNHFEYSAVHVLH